MTWLSNATLSYVDIPGVEARPSPWSLLQHGMSLTRDRPSPALISMHQPPDHLSSFVASTYIPSSATCLTWSFEDLVFAAERLAGSLAAAGARPGQALVTLLPNGAEWLLAFWAAARLRLTFVPLDQGVLSRSRDEELRFFVRALRADVLIAADASEAQPWRDLAVEQDILDVLYICLDGAKNDWIPFEMLAQEKASSQYRNLPEGLDDPDRLAEILFTSGTSTGEPKGCPLTVANIMHGHATYIRSRGVDPSTRNVLHSANYRAGASGYAFACGGGGGALIMPGEKFAVRTIFEAVELQRANYLWCMPAQVFALSMDPGFPSRDLSAMRLVFISGDIVTRSTITQGEKIFPNARILTGHGMTEGVGNLGWWDKPSSIPTFGEILSVGKVLPGTRAKICDDDGNVVHREQTGELHIGGQKLIAKYFDGVQADMFYTDREGDWMKSGDRAMIDEGGFVYIVGRSKDIIKRISVPIPPSVIESCFTKYGIEQAQVVGVPSPMFGECPVAILASFNGRSEKELKDNVVDLLGSDYRVEHILLLSELGLTIWPLNASGKVMKHVLRDTAIVYLQEQHGCTL